ncbi:MAG: hypothetical protein ABIY51_14585 [Ferruginibacter sp.]
MKKLTTIVTAIAIFFSTVAFASGIDPVSTEVKTAFLKKFSTAESVSWKKNGDLYFASFQVNQNSFFAAYNEKAELVALSRNIQLSQLPLQLSQALAERYSSYTLSRDVTEMVLEGETSYYLNAESKDKTLQLKGKASGDIEVVSKTKK